MSAARVVLGVDPGKLGGWVALDERGAVLGHARTALIAKREHDVLAIVDVLRAHARPSIVRDASDVPPTLAIEEMSPGAFSGRVTTATAQMGMGESYGYWIGAATALGYAVSPARPSDWTRVMLAGMPRGFSPDGKRSLTKESSVIVASRLFPALAPLLRVKANWALADAALIAEFTRRRIVGAADVGP